MAAVTLRSPNQREGQFKLLSHALESHIGDRGQALGETLSAHDDTAVFAGAGRVRLWRTGS
jgi:hypothetical protein